MKLGLLLLPLPLMDIGSGACADVVKSTDDENDEGEAHRVVEAGTDIVVVVE